MANIYTSLHYHIVFSTKHREPWITVEIEQRIWAFLGGIARENRLKPLQIGGVDDHIHLLLGARATMAPAKAAQLIKGGSSTWIHTEFSGAPQFCVARRLWIIHCEQVPTSRRDRIHPKPKATPPGKDI